METKSENKQINVDMSELLKVFASKPSQIMAGMCGIPEKGCTVRITANAEVEFIPTDDKKKSGVKHK